MKIIENKKIIAYFGIFNILLLWGFVFYLFSTLESLKTVWWLILYGSISVFDVIVATDLIFSIGFTVIFLLFGINIFLVLRLQNKLTLLVKTVLILAISSGIGMAWVPFRPYFFLHISLVILLVVPLMIMLSKKIGWSILALQTIMLIITFLLIFFITGTELFIMATFTYWHIKYQILAVVK